MEAVIEKYTHELLFKDAEVRKYLCNIIRSIESDIIDLTQFVDYRYSGGDTSFTFFKNRFITSFRRSNPNDSRANITPWNLDAVKISPIKFHSKQMLNRYVKNKFGFLNILSDLYMQNNRARMLEFNDMIYGTPIKNALGTNATVGFTASGKSMDVETYIKSLGQLKKSASVDSSLITTFFDVDSMTNMRMDPKFSNYDFNTKGGLEDDYRIYNFLGTKIVEVVPRDTTFGNQSIRYSMNNTATALYTKASNAKASDKRAYATMFNKYSIGAVESDMSLEYENAPVTEEAEFFALYSEINVCLVFNKGIHIIESTGY